MSPISSGKAMSMEQDDQLLHDIAVPRYSAIGTVTPNRIVLFGAYLLFVPGSFVGLLIAYDALWDGGMPRVARVLIVAGYLFSAVVSFLIIYKTQKRYRAAKRAAMALP